MDKTFLIKSAAFMFFITSVFSFTSKAQTRMEISIDTANTITTVPDNFEGLSYEMEKLLPDSSGHYYFSSQNRDLIAVFKLLGIKSLRVGGNTADRPSVPVPDKKDIDSLFSFAEAAGVKVIYTLRLREEDAGRASEIAKYILRHYKNYLECFAVGNEPNVFAKEYGLYKNEFQKYADLINLNSNSPGAKFCGPSTTPGKTSWAVNFADDFGKKGIIDFISQHAYSGGNGATVVNKERARKEMLSKKWADAYEKFYDSFAPQVKRIGLRYRIEETNSYYNGGADGVSNTFASALWGLDYMYWWASHYALGLNFHTGDFVAAGEENNICQYAVFVTSPRGYSFRPLGYAMKAFMIGSEGNLIMTKIISDSANLNCSVYAVYNEDGNVFITAINKEVGPGGREANLKLNLNCKIKYAGIMFMTSPDGDVSAPAGTELGGSPIKDDAAWAGNWEDISNYIKGNYVTVDLHAATAAVIKLKIK